MRGEDKLETQESMLEKLITKAQEDSDFRGRLVTDPNSAVKETFDMDVPDGFNIVVHEDNARTAHLVLPASTELTDTQLEQATGGSSKCYFLWWS